MQINDKQVKCTVCLLSTSKYLKAHVLSKFPQYRTFANQVPIKKKLSKVSFQDLLHTIWHIPQDFMFLRHKVLASLNLEMKVYLYKIQEPAFIVSLRYF